MTEEREKELRQKLVDHRKQVQDTFDYILTSRKPTLKVTGGIRHLITTNIPKDMALAIDARTGEVVGLIKSIGE